MLIKSNIRRITRRPNHIPFILCLLAILCVRCANPTMPVWHEEPHAPPAGLAYDYRLRLPTMHPDSLSVTLTVRGQASTPISLVLPFVYADNPVDSMTGPIVPEFSVSDADGNEVHTFIETRWIGPAQSKILTVPAGLSYPLTLTYRPKVNRVKNLDGDSSLPSVFLTEREGFLLGSHLFAVPYESTLPALWRTRRTIKLTVELGENISIAGVPIGTTYYSNAYALLFVQPSFDTELLTTGNGGGLSYEFHSFSGYRPPSQILQRTANDFAVILDSLIPIYGALGGMQTYPVFFRNEWGGLEGTHSFTCFYPDFRSRGIVAMVLAHELIHDAVGIQCGDYDDPWWKEGVTNYLGWASATRLGLAEKEECYEDLIGIYDSSIFVARYAPSSRALRYNIFTDGVAVAYGKGAQIAMCMDLAVRRATGNTRRLDETIAALCRAYEHGAFTQNQMVAHFRAYTGADIAPILTEYADKAGAIPQTVLDSTFTTLDSLGAFGQKSMKKHRYLERIPPGEWIKR
ncbi:MAG: hypothetical protein GF344_18845 [Chitinivibrionales bacterium]|nr:hypothetical protein [Chitinivibrionales bacterium]MBD3358700.1 hypothetical protein [Chitinivibrionales bacterium]